MLTTNPYDNSANLYQKIEELAPWFHNIHLPDGTETAPHHFLGDFPNFKWKEISPHIPLDLQGWKVLDIGCNAGFYSIELAKRGAHVTSIDLDPHFLRQAEWVISQFKLEDKITLYQKQVYDLAQEEMDQYDLIWFMGVFYHLRYPLLALDIVAQKTKNLLVFQTLTMPGEADLIIDSNYNLNDRAKMLHEGWPKMCFIEDKLNNDPTNWWVPNTSCIMAMLRTCRLKITARPGHEIFICQLDPTLPTPAFQWNRSEYLSATGRPWQEAVEDKLGKKLK